MGNYNKVKGTQYERDIMNALRMLSFYVIRAYSSVGVADLVATPAWNPKSNYRPLLIQAKNNQVKDYIVPFERDHLNYLQQINSGMVILAYKDDSKVMIKIWESGEKLGFNEFILKYYGISCNYSELLKGYREYRRPIHLYKPEKEDNGTEGGKFVAPFQDFFAVNAWYPYIPERNIHEKD